MISAILRFIGINKWLLIAVVTATAVSFTAAWQVQGWRYGNQIAEMQNQQWQAVVESQNQVNESLLLQNRNKDLVSQNRALARKKQQTVTQYVTREVTKYVQTPDAGQCHFTDDWLRSYNAAASNQVPDSNPATGTDANAGKVTDIEVLQNATGNYATCNSIRQDLIGLQEWVRLNIEMKQ